MRQEIDLTFSDVTEIHDSKAIQKCKYLCACIDESLRLSPPVGGLLEREVLDGGLELNGHFFPIGTNIGVPIYALHHNEEFFAEPFTYRPERWLHDPKADNPGFLAFSHSTRSCVGKRMAYMELTLVIGRMVRLYDMQLASGIPEESPDVAVRRRDAESMDKFVSKVQGPKVVLRRRNF